MLEPMEEIETIQILLNLEQKIIDHPAVCGDVLAGYVEAHERNTSTYAEMRANNITVLTPENVTILTQQLINALIVLYRLDKTMTKRIS